MHDPASESQPPAPKSRHGCATVWLVIVILANTGAAVIYLAQGSAIKRQLPDFPDWAFPALIACGVLNVVFAVALMAWKKWAFYAFAVTTVLIVVINLAAGFGARSVVGLLGVVILYAVLQIGGERSTWKQLE
jgi:hypothetical protein